MTTASHNKSFKNTIEKITPTHISSKIKELRHKNRTRKLISKAKNIQFPKTLNLSLSALCQARCIYCPPDRGKGIKPPLMPFKTAKKVIDEAARENFKGTVRFSENGEALLNKDFMKIFEYYSSTLPKCKSVLFSNMALLYRQIASKLLENNLHELHLNIDGAAPETYRAAKNLDFQTFKAHFHDFLDTREKLSSPCKIHIHILTAKNYMLAIEQKDIDLPDDSAQIVEYWKPDQRQLFLPSGDS
jgi:sulfatase maturation enzyme AslB (radical SAM superfamily)